MTNEETANKITNELKMKGCNKKFNYTCYSVMGTSLTSEKVCGWHNGNGGFYLCSDCENTNK